MNRRDIRQRRPLRHRYTLLCAGVLVVAGVLVYAQGLDAPFIFDDYTSVLGNTTIRHLWPPADALTPPRDTPVAGRPLINLSLAVNYAIGGLDVRSYRITNLLIHLLASSRCSALSTDRSPSCRSIHYAITRAPWRSRSPRCGCCTRCRARS
jgi:hypothetical protein